MLLFHALRYLIDEHSESVCNLYSVGRPDLPPPLIPATKAISLERFAGPKEDLYTAVNKPLKKKPEAAKLTPTTSYTKLSDLNVSNNPTAAVATTAATDHDKVVSVSTQDSYSEVSLDQRPELEPASRRESAVDDEMWVTVKWRQQQEILKQKDEQKQQQKHSEFVEDDPEALALRLLGGGGGSHHTEHMPLQDYSNLTDINTGQAFVGEVKRTEEDSNKIYIEGNNAISDDISIPTHDYVNHDTDDGKEEKQLKQQAPQGDMYSEIDDVDEIIKKLDEKKRQQNGPLPSVPPTSDYVNTVTTPSPPPPPKV